MNTNQLLEPGIVYHIYNKARNGENLFHEPTNYSYFLKLYERYLFECFETFAWVLMPNHFHLLVKTSNRLPDKPFHQYLSNLFNAYTKAFNKRYDRSGPLFISPYQRIAVNNSRHFRNLIHYIHNNPVRKGLVATPDDWYYSSSAGWSSVRDEPLVIDKDDWPVT